MRHSQTARILAIEARRSRFGYALFEGPKRLLDWGADVDERTLLEQVEEPVESSGRPLWIAAATGQREIAELLLDRGAASPDRVPQARARAPRSPAPPRREW